GGDAPGQNQDPGPDLRAQRSQVESVEGRTDEHMDAGVPADQGLDDPEADVVEAPQTDLLGLPTAYEEPLRADGNGADDQESHAGGENRSQANRDDTRTRRDPRVDRADAEHGTIGIHEVKQSRQCSTEDVLARAGRVRSFDSR